MIEAFYIATNCFINIANFNQNSRDTIICIIIPFERYLILIDARTLFDKERLIKLCEAYQNDENKYVKEKAIEILNEIKSE
jgi:HEAT repeat protein